MSAKKAALGRGLGALLEGSSTNVSSGDRESNNIETVESNNLENGSVSLMSISKVEANRFHPDRRG